MNDLDDWLNSLGFDDNSNQIDISSGCTSAPIIADSQPSQDPADNPITIDSFNEILEDNGFQEPVYEEAEEVEEEGENTEEYSENSGEGRDLDIEEEAENIQAVQDVNENYPEHNPDEIDRVHFHLPDSVISVPVIQPSQEVSQNAMEAFDLLQQPEHPAVEPLLAPNSPTLLMNDATSRFSGTEWYNEIQKARIILAGCGGIGSWTILQLARMNPAALFMYDDDVVEQANMSGQLYCIEDVGKAKVDAMADMIRSYTTMRNIYAIKDKFTQSCEAGDIMICGFDNMKARRDFFAAWNNHVMNKLEGERKKCLYLDGIMKCLSDNL